MTAELEPADLTQCQAEKPTGQNAFTLGIGPVHKRCQEIPVVIVTEEKAGEDGQKGSMSLCADCLDVFNAQAGVPRVTVKVIQR